MTITTYGTLQLSLEAPSRGCCGKPEPPISPQLQQKIQTLGETIVAFTRSGFELTERALRKQRTAVCAGEDGHPPCPAYVLNFCRDCKCFLPAKVRVAVATCPRDMWPIVVPNGEQPAEMINPSTDLGTICVVLPHLGTIEQTYAAVREICVEAVHVVVVDCVGDYISIMEEYVCGQPGLDFDTAVDYGIKYAWEEELPQSADTPLMRKYRFVVPLSVGVKLSPNFFRNLLWAYRETTAPVIAATPIRTPAINHVAKWEIWERPMPPLVGTLLTREGYPLVADERCVTTPAAALNPD